MTNTNENIKSRFKDYFDFIYLNTTMNAKEALTFARNCWNAGYSREAALEKAWRQD